MADRKSKINSDKPIIVLTGPTASGKTSLSLDLAKMFNGEIICADSMTVYQGMDIGTDKVTIQNSKLKIKKESQSVIPVQATSYVAHSRFASDFKATFDVAGIRPSNVDSGQARMTIKDIPHHMLDILNPDEEFSVAIFKNLAEEKINEIHSRGNIPFLVGGSTMYIDALVYDYAIPKAKPDLKLRKDLEEKTNEELFEQLIELDPDAEWTIDKDNKRRLVRALEVCLQTGEPFTKQKTKNPLPENVLYLALSTPLSVIPKPPIVIPAEAGIQSKDTDSGQARITNENGRQYLYERINARVDEMMAEGFLDEVEKLHKKYDLNTAMQATGYKQLAQYIDGELSLEEAVEKTKQSHRNYAKRQLTWLNKNKDVIWIEDNKEAKEIINNFLSV